VSQILTSTLEDAERVQELLATRNWAWVADRYSVDPVAKRGGDLGYLTKGNMIPELEEVVFNMKPGETTGIIKSDFGYHIFRLEDVREALVAVGLDDVREQIMNHLMLEKRKNAYRELIDSLAACAEITYRDKAYLRTSESEPSSGAADISEEADSSAVP
jgi:peptidyl-prolyl cis-trans isomerase C